MYIRETNDDDLNDILLVEREAFDSSKEAELTRALLTDPTAKPLLSLLAFVEDQPAGHILRRLAERRHIVVDRFSKPVRFLNQ